jgi:hypothetical protein
MKLGLALLDLGAVVFARQIQTVSTTSVEANGPSSR